MHKIEKHALELNLARKEKRELLTRLIDKIGQNQKPLTRTDLIKIVGFLSELREISQNEID